MTEPASKPERPGESSSAAAPKTERSSTIEKFDIVSKFFIGLGGVALSGAVGFSTLYFSHQATERQANTQIEVLSLQRRSAAAQLELSLLPVLARGPDVERHLALSILASLAPDEAERLGAVVIPQLKSEAERQTASQMISSIPERKRQQDLRRRLQNADVYRQFSLDANACREYFSAFESLSAAERQRVATEFESARREYSRGQFSDAAARLQAALGTK